jgi:peptide/nickel transport system substrate-binding protein
VRQALIYALDRQTYVDTWLGSFGTVGMAPISPASWAFSGAGLNNYAFNLDKARELLHEAGWEPGDDGILVKDGVRMELRWLVYHDVPWPAVIASFAEDSWRQIGVELTIEYMSHAEIMAATFGTDPQERDFDMFAMGFIFPIDPDPTGALFDHNAFIVGGLNASGYFNTRAQELIALGRTTFSRSERANIYREWAQIMNESLPTVIIAYRYDLWVVGYHVRGMTINTYQDWWQSISNITLE